MVPVWRQPFDMIAVANHANSGGTDAGLSKNGQFENWLPGVDSNST